MAKILFTVTNELNFDQRMIRICTTLQEQGYEVVLIGRSDYTSKNLTKKAFQQKRLFCFAKRGFLFYAEYNLRLFFYLLFHRFDAVCAIDLDTILPCLWATQIKKKKRIYDAHELFCEMKEIVSRPKMHAFWKKVESYAVPQFKLGYTVNQVIADEFYTLYGLKYDVVRSISLYNNNTTSQSRNRSILYQGAVNEGRCFEQLIPAMKMVDSTLHIYGVGNFLAQAKQQVKELGLTDKIFFHGNVLPEELKAVTSKHYIGITLFEPGAKSNYYSLANRFFDYLHAETPQLTSNFPVYRQMNNIHQVSLLIEETTPVSIANHLNQMLNDDKLWQQLHLNCKKAAAEWNWQTESNTLIQFYEQALA